MLSIAEKNEKVNEFPCKLDYKDITGECSKNLVVPGNCLSLTKQCVNQSEKKHQFIKEFLFFTGDIVEQYIYDQPVERGKPSPMRGDRLRNLNKKNLKKKKKKTLKDIQDAREKRRNVILNNPNLDDNLRRSQSRRKKEVRRYVNANCTSKNIDYCSFFTATYAENMRDEFKAREDFNLFIKRLNFHYSDEFSHYLYVVERQKRGAIHFHVIFFDCPFVDQERLSEIWGKGFIKIRALDSAKNAGAYVAKYVGKGFTGSPIFGRKWGKSKNLKGYTVDYLVNYSCFPSGQNFVKVKSYCYQRDKFGFVHLNIYNKSGFVYQDEKMKEVLITSQSHITGFATPEDIKNCPFF